MQRTAYRHHCLRDSEPRRTTALVRSMSAAKAPSDMSTTANQDAADAKIEAVVSGSGRRYPTGTAAMSADQARRETAHSVTARRRGRVVWKRSDKASIMCGGGRLTNEVQRRAKRVRCNAGLGRIQRLVVPPVEIFEVSVGVCWGRLRLVTEKTYGVTPVGLL